MMGVTTLGAVPGLAVAIGAGLWLRRRRR
jgi:hypothetical protein